MDKERSLNRRSLMTGLLAGLFLRPGPASAASSGSLRLGIGRLMVPIPAFIWKREVAGQARALAARVAALSSLDLAVRAFAVREMPRVSAPIPPELISSRLGASLEQVKTSLEVLERGMAFLVRNAEGAVAWVFPLTVDQTPHHLTFDSGERLDAA